LSEDEMEKTIALLHTSFVFLNVEKSLMQMLSEVLSKVRSFNIVDDALLADVISEGRVTPAITRRVCFYCMAAEARGANAILSLCSSVGDAVDVARNLVRIPILKIDDAMTERAVSAAETIGVLATVPSTLDPTIRLLQSKANLIHRQVKAEPILCEGAFDILMSGAKEKHDQIVLEKARSVAGRFDVLLLAQASMARLGDKMSEEVAKPVFSSPKLFVEKVRQLVEEL